MNPLALLLELAAASLRLRRPMLERAGSPRILVIRRNRMGDMLSAVPLFHALRRHHPKAYIGVACDPLGEPIAHSCEPVNEITVLVPGWNPWQAAYRNAAALQGFDWVIAAKGGFDRRLAVFARLTNAPVRIGFEPPGTGPSLYYTNPVPPPAEAHGEHQVDTLMRLLKPVGLVNPTALSVDLSLRVPEASREFAAGLLAKPPFSEAKHYMLINFSSTVGLKFREEDFIALTRRILGATPLAVGLVAAPMQQQLVREIAMCMASKRIAAIDTPGPMDLAALMERALLVITPEGGAAHLAASMGTPAVVLWSEGPFEKWRSRGKRHTYLIAEPGETLIPLERVWDALQPYLNTKDDGIDRMLTDLLEEPPSLGTLS
ncbi:MAG: glycosyltransferase family 9 protein [Verrucomicrobiota bacterium]